MMSRSARLAVVVLIAATVVLPAASSTAAPSAPDDNRMPVYIDATGFWMQGPFREYWETHGGLSIFGYPITGIFFDGDYYKQYFERAIFEWHPEHAGTQYEVLLQRLGAIRAAGRESEPPFVPIDTEPDANCDFFDVTGHRLCFAFRSYWHAHGGLPNFGYPLSEEFDERNAPPPAGDGEVHTAQYFERTRFEYHPEYAGTQYEVLLGLLGSEYLAANPAPAAAVARQDPTLPPLDPTTNLPYGAHAGYGFNAFMRGDEQPDRAEFNGRTLDMITGAGFSWLHFQVEWRSFEVEPGVYDPRPLDRIVDQVSARNVKILVSVVGPAPNWLGAGGSIPDDTSGYQNMLRFLAERYRGRIHAWEVWNEQNLAYNMGGWVEVEPYIRLLRSGYLGVKEGDPSAAVLFGALTPNGVTDPSIALDDVGYLRAFYEWNNGEAKQYYDILGAHPGSNCNSPDGSWPANPECEAGWNDHNSFYFRRIEDLRAVMVEHGEAEKQIWLTEFGWTTANQAPGYEYGQYNSEQEQADYLVRAYEIAKWEWPWIGVMFVWNLNYAIIAPPSDEKFPWAVLNSDWSPRPAYEALKNMPK